MKAKDYLRIIVIFGIIGTLFSGYLTYYTFTKNKPGCELYFFGLPSCFFGALMYVIVFVLSLLVVLDAASRNKKTIAISVVSAIGIVFASFLTWYILSLKSCTSLDIYGIPPCIYGFIMYLVILLLAVLSTLGKK